MKCNKGKLCNNFILSSSVTVEGTSLVINIPSLPCVNGCLVIAQTIPDTATVNMPVVVTIGDDAAQYPVMDKCGIQLSAGKLSIRTRYSFKFINGDTGSVFKLCNACCRYNVIPGSVVTQGGN